MGNGCLVLGVWCLSGERQHGMFGPLAGGARLLTGHQAAFVDFAYLLFACGEMLRRWRTRVWTTAKSPTLSSLVAAGASFLG